MRQSTDKNTFSPVKKKFMYNSCVYTVFVLHMWPALKAYLQRRDK